MEYYSNTILHRIPGIERSYLAADSVKATDTELPSPDSALDYVARQTPPRLLDHTLLIKTNGMFRLLRNFSLDHQLVKNVRVVVVDVGNQLITV